MGLGKVVLVVQCACLEHLHCHKNSLKTSAPFWHYYRRKSARTLQRSAFRQAPVRAYSWNSGREGYFPLFLSIFRLFFGQFCPFCPLTRGHSPGKDTSSILTCGILVQTAKQTNGSGRHDRWWPELWRSSWPPSLHPIH